MLRVQFTSEDIARIRVAAEPDPLWEITNSFQILGARGTPMVFAEWRRSVRPSLPAASRLLAELLPASGYSPDFLTPDLGGRFDLPSAVETVLGTAKTDLRKDLERLAVSRPRLRPVPSDVRALAGGDTAALGRLRAALCGYHRHALAPFWPQIRARVDADRAIRTRALLEGGIDGLLASFRPLLRWKPPVLEADYPVRRVLQLDGRGLLLQPSFFCTRRPVTLADPRMTPTLVYPIQHTLGWAAASRKGTPGTTAGGAELAALIGRTRAAVLEDLTDGRTTGELAERLSISAQDVSYHTAVLRRAGLLLSVRRSKNTLHTITPAGRTLLTSPSGTSIDG